MSELNTNHNIDPQDQLRFEGSILVLDEVPPEALGIFPHAPTVLDNGFVKYGQNPPERIRGISELEGVPLKDLASSLPMLSRTGRLTAQGRPLASIMANASAAMERADLSNERLAGFLRYSAAATDLLYDSPQGAAIDERQWRAFSSAGKTYATRRTEARCAEPLLVVEGDKHLAAYQTIDLSTGAALHFTGRDPSLADRYGLYVDTSPEELNAFMSPAPEDDPIVALRRDAAAAVDLTMEAFERMTNLHRVGIDITTSPNYQLAPMSLGEVQEIANRRHEAPAIADHITADYVIPAAQNVSPLALGTKFEFLKNYPPNLRQAALKAIGTITIQEGVAAADSLRRSFASLQAAANADPHEAETPFEVELMRKLDLTDPYTTKLTHKSLAAAYAAEDDTDSRTALVAAIERAFPTLEASVAAMYAAEGVTIPVNADIEAVLDLPRLEALKAATKTALLMINDDRGTALAYVSMIAEALRSPEDAFTEDNLQLLSTLGIDPAITAFMISQAAPTPTALPRITRALLGNSAKSEYDRWLKQEQGRAERDAQLALIQDIADPRAHGLLVAAFDAGDSRNEPYATTARQTVEAIQEIFRQRQQADGDIPPEPIGYAEAALLYTAALQPQFAEFFGSDIVADIAVEKGSVRVTLDSAKVVASPVLGRDPQAGRGSPAREFVVSGKLYWLTAGYLTAPDAAISMYVQKGTQPWDENIVLVA